MKARISLGEISKELMGILLKPSQYIRKSGLDPKLVELLDFRVSTINGCAYCLEMHFKDAMALGESEQRLYSLAARREALIIPKKNGLHWPMRRPSPPTKWRTPFSTH